MKTTILEPSGVWEYFQENCDDLRDMMFLVAENDEYGTEIYITNDGGLPAVIVTADGVQVFEEAIVSERDCEKTVGKAYDTYLTEAAVQALLEDMYLEDDEELSINEREEELNDAIYDFLIVVLDGFLDENSCDYDKLCEDLKDHFCEYIARKHELPVRRPMYLEYEDGRTEYEEYPYEHMDFEDEDNPIYEK